MKRGAEVGVDELVRKAKQGNRDALIELVMLRKQEYYKLAYVFLGNKEDALDAMEDMIVILYENISRLKKDEAFSTWSKTILVNCCKKILKNNRKTVSIETIEEIVAEDGIEHKDNQILLEKYLSQLSDKHQEVIRLRYFLDLEYQVIADILKIPLGTVKSRIAYGIERLKECFGGETSE
ncbi:RNA polymerase sigma factor [Desulforamulus aquiferis]|uniref:Sigma-70 family RNA polymerase sigma factor n=1 Tax=Desulforamulus aquiferis TaxID=1397668 RepID=A0AAW7ZAZ6_9FIRM|nr:sigma-70 family RNA polymerase sigma factor [Desulforamulus aquiferis]MDO7786588.1 sigma-70 family RNA polymerase sigma factor [Desulforamulus aquiferis]